MIKVYIASPYTLGDVAVNVKTQIDVADELISRGFSPFVPLLFHFQHMVHPRPYTDWISMDLDWVEVCDVVLRLPGESEGADNEVKHAIEQNIPVYYSLEELYSMTIVGVYYNDEELYSLLKEYNIDYHITQSPTFSWDGETVFCPPFTSTIVSKILNISTQYLSKEYTLNQFLSENKNNTIILYLNSNNNSIISHGYEIRCYITTK